MDLLNFVISALSGAVIGFSASLLWRWSKKPKKVKPVDRHEIPRLREEITVALNEYHKDDPYEFGLAASLAQLEEEKSVEYLRLYAKFSKNYSISAIHRSAVLLQVATQNQYGTKRKAGYTDYGTHVELSPWHIDLWRSFEATESNYEPETKTIEDKIEVWGKVSILTTYAYQHPDEAEKMLSIVRDRGIYELETVQALLKDMKTPGAGAISSGAL